MTSSVAADIVHWLRRNASQIDSQQANRLKGRTDLRRALLERVSSRVRSIWYCMSIWQWSSSKTCRLQIACSGISAGLAEMRKAIGRLLIGGRTFGKHDWACDSSFTDPAPRQLLDALSLTAARSAEFSRNPRSGAQNDAPKTSMVNIRARIGQSGRNVSASVELVQLGRAGFNVVRLHRPGGCVQLSQVVGGTFESGDKYWRLACCNPVHLRTLKLPRRASRGEAISGSSSITSFL